MNWESLTIDSDDDLVFLQNDVECVYLFVNAVLVSRLFVTGDNLVEDPINPETTPMWGTPSRRAALAKIITGANDL